MYNPRSWYDFANTDLMKIWSSFASPDKDNDEKKGIALGNAEMSPVLWKREPEYNSKPSATWQAVTCGDAPDLQDVKTSQIFDEVLRVTKEVSGFCTLFRTLRISHHLMEIYLYSWSPYPSALSLLPSLACTSCRALQWHLQRHSVEPDPRHRKQGRPNYPVSERPSGRRYAG